ncbi:MAG: hypothetical protein NC398_06285 [Acetatifactor muris]|nr:hypothetical protein [Acetatifactor muris]MCM1526643.1 hypothetical protein [Bacteroides sp.]
MCRSLENRIEQAIQEYDKVVLLTEDLCETFYRDFLTAEILDRKILILSVKLPNMRKGRVVCEQIDEETAQEIYGLYHTYEFADNFVVIGQSATFASIFNYVRTGILTPKEAWQALLEG